MSETEIENKFCPHCPRMESLGLSHNKKCRCGHNHWQHNFAGGCTICTDCDCYDQSERVVREPAVKIPTIEAIGPKPKKGKIVIFDDSIIVSTEKQEAHDTLIAAQARVNELKQKVRALSPTAGPSPD